MMNSRLIHTDGSMTLLLLIVLDATSLHLIPAYFSHSQDFARTDTWPARSLYYARHRKKRRRQRASRVHNSIAVVSLGGAAWRTRRFSGYHHVLSGGTDGRSCSRSRLS